MLWYTYVLIISYTRWSSMYIAPVWSHLVDQTTTTVLAVVNVGIHSIFVRVRMDAVRVQIHAVHHHHPIVVFVFVERISLVRRDMRRFTNKQVVDRFLKNRFVEQRLRT